MIQRLHVRIYLTTLASLAAVVVLCALLWQFAADHSEGAGHDHVMSALVTRALPAKASPADLQAALDGLVVAPIRGVALFDPKGVRIAAAGQADGLDAASIHRAYEDHMMSTLHAIPLDDGRVVVVRVRSNGWELHLRGFALLLLVGSAVALGTWPVVRRLTRRLEGLAVAVDRFGQGDLAARATVSGRDEVSSLAARFNGMADRVAGLLDAHRRMLMNASHELRSPLARIRMALALHAADPRPELLQGMHRDCAEIDEQIEEILLASKLDTVQTVLPPGTVDLEVVLAEECSRVDVPFESVPAEVRGDVRLLRRLVRNLLENALKHGGTGVDATLSIGAGGERVLQVLDRGPGIPEAERERVFEPFYRPANAPETGTGWGLGLALVRQIADHHQGRVRCLAREDGGCVFELVLPDPGKVA